MYKSSKLLFNLCVTSLVVSLSVVSVTTASHSKPDTIKSNIQVAQYNACAGANPCASANPCAGANPCASKLGSVGGPLAKELQGKPVFVEVYATWCAGCQNIKSTLSELKKQYGEQVHFIVLDVTNKSAAKKSQAKAEKLGLGKFFAENKSKTSTVVIVDPSTGNILSQEKNNANKSAYTEVLDTQLAKK